jgi:multiple sugar transport system permease protein/putative aldouronate transport system permease protein
MSMKKSSIKKSRGEKIFDILVYTFVTLFCLFCLFPFVLILGSSFETEANLSKFGYSMIPKDFTLTAYKIVLGDAQIFKAYGVTIFTTVVGTLVSMFLTITMAYPLSLKKVKFRNPIMFFIYFTMLFNGGLVPSYLLISKTLKLSDNIWVLILPMAFSAWNMILMRNFFNTVPTELSESAYIDGANDMQILWKVVLPVAVPGIATISMFYALTYWNQWFGARLYITNNRDLYPLQYLLMDMLNSVDAMKEMARNTGVAVGNVPAYTLRMATTVVAIGPVILIYPFAQKYFTSGLTVGAIKG